MKPGELPFISVVMPCYNCVDYIERSIRSVVEQDYPRIELFIKDGLSQDGTVDIIRHYAKKYPKNIIWVTSKDKGQTDAINIGMKRVKGEILTYLNADDVYQKGAFKIVGEYFADHPGAMWVYGKCDIIDGDDKPIRGWITAYKNFWLRFYFYKTLLVLNYISQMTVFWRREAAKKVGEFDIEQHYVMDYDYWLRMGSKFRAHVINAYLASFRITPNTKSSTGFIKQFKDEFETSKKHTNSGILLGLHKLHYLLIILIYSVIKIINSFPGKANTSLE